MITKETGLLYFLLRVGCVGWQLVNVHSMFWQTEEHTALLQSPHLASNHYRGGIVRKQREITKRSVQALFILLTRLSLHPLIPPAINKDHPGPQMHHMERGGL